MVNNTELRYRIVKYTYGKQDRYVLHEAIDADGEVYIMGDSVEIAGSSVREIINQLDEMRMAAVNLEVLTEEQAFGSEEEDLDEEPEEEILDVFDMMTKGGRYDYE